MHLHVFFDTKNPHTKAYIKVLNFVQLWYISNGVRIIISFNCDQMTSIKRRQFDFSCTPKPQIQKQFACCFYSLFLLFTFFSVLFLFLFPFLVFRLIIKSGFDDLWTWLLPKVKNESHLIENLCCFDAFRTIYQWSKSSDIKSLSPYVHNISIFIFNMLRKVAVRIKMDNAWKPELRNRTQFFNFWIFIQTIKLSY